MTQPKPMPMVHRLLPRHTEAGIEVSYDDHCVSLRRDGLILRRKADGILIIAVWAGLITLKEMVAEADHYLPKEMTV